MIRRCPQVKEEFESQIVTGLDEASVVRSLAKVSIELMQDSMFDLESYIAGEFARAFGIAEEES